MRMASRWESGVEEEPNEKERKNCLEALINAVLQGVGCGDLCLNCSKTTPLFP